MTEEKKTEFTRAEIAAHFAASPKVKVVFEKKDGTIRTMIATTQMDAIPENHRPEEREGGAKKVTPDHLFAAFDLEANGFRSFTIAKVLSIEPTF